ncbi:hypothetical protein BDZ94DRAFT_1325056 [Collybia nuda]|uniref:F-box domain-containing protein n=1 Tax=Collybia nuda TaxID=64659 RepID=A0A9P6CB26_9AGAR|nr:hypothetical protein BDZ94DRAFT_1325056 [Collybia nuda]
MSSTVRNDIKNSTLHTVPHTALQIEDIIDQILLKLVEDEQVHKADLLSMARCCKSFMAPSLNRLWANMKSVVPLLKLIDGTEEVQGAIIIADDLEYGELPLRFHAYAKRIHALEYDVTTNFVEIDVSTWIRLAQLEHALLPNLTSLRVTCTIAGGGMPTIERDKALLLLPVLAQPSTIRSFTFTTPSVTSYDSRSEVGPFLSILGGYKLNLENLVVSGTFTARYLNRITKMQTLRSASLQLALDSAIPAVLTALSSLPRLHTLKLEFLGIMPSRAELGSNTFQGLLNVVLTGGTSFISRTLASMACPCLECVDIKIVPLNLSGVADIPPSQDKVLPYLQLSRFQTLKRISLELSGCAPPSHSGQRQNRLNFVTSILENRRIEELVITSLGPEMCFSDHEVSELATAWPFLRILRLEHTWHPSEQPSFTSLNHLTTKCPHLKEISVTLCEGDTEDLYHNSVSRPGTSVWHLNLQHTSVKDYASAGQYIDELFPFLNKFSLHEEQACVYMQGVILRACQVVRRRARSRQKPVKCEREHVLPGVPDFTL